MAASAGYILRLSRERHQLLLDALESDDLGYWSRPGTERSFAEPVAEFVHSRNVPLLCFVFNATEELTHVGRGKRGMLAGTELRRLNLVRITTLDPPIKVAALTEALPPTFAKRVAGRIAAGGLVPPKSFSALVAAVVTLAPNTAATLQQFSQDRRDRIASIPHSAMDALAEQKEGVATALAIAGIPRTVLQGWDFEPGTKPQSFLHGLPQVRLREDAMILTDLVGFPGHRLVESMAHTAVAFQGEGTRLTIVLANRLPLEELLGTDLIYYNETFKCFIMVQYKAMDGKVGSDSVFRLPNSQLDDEIRRMNGVLTELAKSPSNGDVDGYRLTENPFFLKLCPRLQFNPDDQSMTKGMYMPLDYWKLLVEHSGIIGSKGGKAISYKNARRHFDNSEFTRLVAKAWIGSTIAQSAVLETVIRETVASGRAITIAVEERTESLQSSDDIDADPVHDILYGGAATGSEK